MKYTTLLAIASFVFTSLFTPYTSLSAQETGGQADSGVRATTSLERTDLGGDLDGDGYGDIPIREGGQTIDAGSVPETQQIHPDYVDEDSDADGIETEISKEIEVVEYRDGDVGQSRGIVKEMDKATPQLMEALHIDSSSPLLYEGITVRAETEQGVCEEGNDCDDDDREITPRDVSFGLEVDARTVRGWDPDKKEEIQSRANRTGEINTAHDFGIWMASQVLEHEDIESIRTDGESIEVTYETTLYVLGFIPVKKNVIARTSVDGAVEVDYPWYGFLSRKKDSESVAALMGNASLRQQTVARAGGFKAGKALADTVK